MATKSAVPRHSEELAEEMSVMAHHRVTEAQANLDQALAQRRAAVALLREAGWSLARIASLLGITKTAAANICREAR